MSKCEAPEDDGKCMKTTHCKHKKFLCEPMGDKKVDKLPGISAVSACRLGCMGCNYAYAVWGKFLSLGKDPRLFQNWLQQVTCATLPHAEACCDCLMEYTNRFGI